jgi:hypothetical protein
MGIVNPRPAMRRGEARKIREQLVAHAKMIQFLSDNGVSDIGLARHEAFAIVVSHAKRRKVWLRRDEGFQRMMRDFKRSEKVED